MHEPARPADTGGGDERAGLPTDPLQGGSPPDTYIVSSGLGGLREREQSPAELARLGQRQRRDAAVVVAELHVSLTLEPVADEVGRHGVQHANVREERLAEQRDVLA